MPFRIDVSPPQTGVDSGVIRVKPMPTMPMSLADKTCALSIRPAVGSGTSWQGAPDATCSREDTVRLPIGHYTIRLAVLWRPTGSSTGYNQAQDAAYEVKAGDRLRVRGLALEGSPPATNISGKARFEIENVSPVAVRGFMVRGRFHSPDGAQLVLEKRIGAIQPGEVVRDAAAFFPVRPGRSQVSVEADLENVGGEGPGFLSTSKAELQFDVAPGPPPKPLIVPGAIRTQKTLAIHEWILDFTVCNVDPDALYRPKLTCPTCRDIPPLPILPCTPSRGDCPAGSFSASGIGLAPQCPGGLVFRGAFKPGEARGSISPFADHDYQLTVEAQKIGRTVSSDTRTIHAPTDCRLSPCVRTETFQEQPPSIR